MTKRAIGIFAGTFDPIHDGHVAFAETAIKQAGLDKVILLPETKPRRKTNVTPVSERLAIIEKRVADRDQLDVRLIDQLQFTIDQTLPVLHQLYPDTDFALLIGSDVVRHLHQWQHFETVRGSIKVIVGMRSGYSQPETAAYLDALGVTYDIITTNYGDMASSRLR